MKTYRTNPLIIALFLLPALLIYVTLEVVPVGASFWFSFHEWNGVAQVAPEFVGFDNFLYLMENEPFLRSLRNIFWYVIISVVTQIPIGFTLAILLYHMKGGVRFFRAAFFIPMILPATSTALLWGFILFPNNMGLLNSLLTKVGLAHWASAWLVDERYAFMWVIIITTWVSVGYYLIIGMAALAGIPQEILEAASIDGATGIKRVWYIMLPMLREAIKISIVLVITGVLKIFDLIFILTGGGPNGATHVPATLMYQESFRYSQYGLGSAISTIIFIISIAASLMTLRLMRTKEA